jgi:hypothetical protein
MSKLHKREDNQDQSPKQAIGGHQSKVASPESRRLPEENVLAVLARYDKLIELANWKASFLLSVIGLILIAGITQKASILYFSEIDKIKWLNDTFYTVSMLALFAVFLLSLYVVLPFTHPGGEHGEYTSFIAYSSVAKMKPEVFRSKLASTDYNFWDDLVRQTYAVGKIVDFKFKLLGFASWFTIAAVIFSATLFCLALRHS